MSKEKKQPKKVEQIERTIAIDLCQALDERKETLLTVCKAIQDLASIAAKHIVEGS